MEELKLKKEWQLMYDVLPVSLKEKQMTETASGGAESTGNESPPNYIAVYTSVTKDPAVSE